MQEKKLSFQNGKNLAAGMFFIAVGLFYGTLAYTTLPMGTALNMGPAYFPIVLSLILIGLGLGIIVQGLRGEQTTPFGVVPWRALFFLSLATLIFAKFFESLGMVPGIFVTCFVASLANRTTGLVAAVLTSLCLAVFCTVVFIYVIHLPVRIIGPAFGNLSF